MEGVTSSPLLRGSLAARLNFAGHSAAADRHQQHQFGTLSPAAVQPIVELPPREACLPDASARRVRELIARYKDLKAKNRRLKELCRQQQSTLAAFQQQGDEMDAERAALKAARDAARASLAQVAEDMERVEAAREAAEHRASSLMEMVEARKQRLSSTPLKYRLTDGGDGGGPGAPGGDAAALVLAHHQRAAGQPPHNAQRDYRAPGSSSGSAATGGPTRGEEKKSGSSVMGRGASMIGSLLSSVSGESGEVKKLRRELEVVLDELGRKLQENENLHMNIFELKTREDLERKHRRDARVSGDKARQALVEELAAQKRLCADSIAAADGLRRERDALASQLADALEHHDQRVKQVMNTAARAIHEAAFLRRRVSALALAGPLPRGAGGGASASVASGSTPARVEWELPVYDDVAHARRLGSLAAFLGAVQRLVEGWRDAAAAAAAWVRTQIAFPKLVFSGGCGAGAGDSGAAGSVGSDHAAGLRAVADHLANMEAALHTCGAAAQACVRLLQQVDRSPVAAAVRAFVQSARAAQRAWQAMLPDCLSLLDLVAVRDASVAPGSPAAPDLQRLEAELRRCSGILGARLKQFDNWLDTLSSLWTALATADAAAAEAGEHHGGTDGDAAAAFSSFLCSWYTGGLTSAAVRRHQQWMVHATSLQGNLAALAQAAIATTELVSGFPAQDVIVHRSGSDAQEALFAADNALPPVMRALRDLYEAFCDAVERGPPPAAGLRGSDGNGVPASTAALDVDSLGAASMSFYTSPLAAQRVGNGSSDGGGGGGGSSSSGGAGGATKEDDSGFAVSPGPRTPPSLSNRPNCDDATAFATSTRTAATAAAAAPSSPSVAVFNAQRTMGVDFLERVNAVYATAVLAQTNGGRAGATAVAPDATPEESAQKALADAGRAIASAGNEAGPAPAAAAQSAATVGSTAAAAEVAATDIAAAGSAAAGSPVADNTNADNADVIDTPSAVTTDPAELVNLRQQVEELRTKLVDSEVIRQAAEAKAASWLHQKKRATKKAARLQDERQGLLHVLEQAKATLVQSREAWQAQDARLKQRIQQLVQENAAMHEAAFQRGVV